MADPNPYSPPSAALEEEPDPTLDGALHRPGPHGLGGWLTLVGFGLIVSPIRAVILLAQTYTPLFRDGTFNALATPSSESFYPAFVALLVAEMVINAALLSFGVWLIVLFFRRSRHFPMRYVALAALTVAFIVGDSFAVAALGLGGGWDAESLRELGRTLIVLMIWGPYMFLSERVKNTFTRR